MSTRLTWVTAFTMVIAVVMLVSTNTIAAELDTGPAFIIQTQIDSSGVTQQAVFDSTAYTTKKTTGTIEVPNVNFAYTTVTTQVYSNLGTVSPPAIITTIQTLATAGEIPSPLLLRSVSINSATIVVNFGHPSFIGIC